VRRFAEGKRSGLVGGQRGHVRLLCRCCGRRRSDFDAALLCTGIFTKNVNSKNYRAGDGRILALFLFAFTLLTLKDTRIVVVHVGTLLGKAVGTGLEGRVKRDNLLLQERAVVLEFLLLHN